MPLPLAIKLHLRRLLFAPAEWLAPRTPPRWLRVVGGGDFEVIGQRFVQHFRNLTQLQPAERVLDIGCGVGRLALPLTEFLEPAGSYLGFDVLRPAVDWCCRHISPVFPNFRFEHLDVRNGAYNPRGRIEPKSVIFPARAGTIDFAFATSVCTHLLRSDVARYLGELQRILRPGGRALLTFFLLDDESRQRMQTPGSLFAFQHQGDGYSTINSRCPETAVAYEMSDVGRLVATAGLAVTAVHPGTWSGREGLEGQDIVLVAKPDRM